ncbi:hypothetical protein [Arthrobacter sp. Soil762]|uniref:hypothetical protein n=1 Tax=Arthrobacter sp. Soil762 TaxID=1736401 RepID=UPI0006FD989A|nr:hypothetical protein [Arthrobacter sp. Soil762]KRE71104.1 hypothetical protein ASG77_13315 [Arthrobacter sp. Soil762]
MSQDNQRTEPDEEVGGYGTPTPEQELGGAETNDPGFEPGEPPVPRNAVVPSAEAEINDANADSQGSEPFSSESGQDAAGLPDGSGTDRPKDKSPNDDGGESFDAG